MKKILLILLLLTSINTGIRAQRKMVIEQVRCYSFTGPVMHYWHRPDIRKLFLKQLNEQLQKYHYATVPDSNLPIQVLSEATAIGKKIPGFSNTDTSAWHLYISLFELKPYHLFSTKNNPEDSSALIIFNRSRSMFQLSILLMDAGKKVLSDRALHISVNAGNGAGMGIVAPDIPLTSKGFSDMLNVGMGLLLDPEDASELIEIKAATPYYADNFILPKVQGQPKIPVTVQKDIFTYTYAGTREMVRMGETYYDEIMIKGRKGRLPLNAALAAAIQHTGNSNSSDFIYLRQECRDVIRNRNYTVKLVTEIHPDQEMETPADAFTHFLPGQLHTLLLDKDTVAAFSITKKLGAPGKKLYTNKISNGYDSSAVTELFPRESVVALVYDYFLEGMAGNKIFSIQCSGKNTLKEIYYDNELVCLAQGKFMPEKIIVLNTSLSTELLNQLLIMAFTRFYD